MNQNLEVLQVIKSVHDVVCGEAGLVMIGSTCPAVQAELVCIQVGIADLLAALRTSKAFPGCRTRTGVSIASHGHMSRLVSRVDRLVGCHVGVLTS